MILRSNAFRILIALVVAFCFIVVGRVYASDSGGNDSGSSGNSDISGNHSSACGNAGGNGETSGGDGGGPYWVDGGGPCYTSSCNDGGGGSFGSGGGGGTSGGYWSNIPQPPAFASFVASQPYNLSGGFVNVLQGGGGGGGAGGTGSSFTATGHLKAIPTLLRRGLTTQLYWNVLNAVSCTVTGQNGDSWTEMSSGPAGKTSGPITAQTIYTLTCTSRPRATPPTITESEVVSIIPEFQER